MKIRYILIVAAIVVIANAAFGGISNALKRSDFNHCKVTTHMTVQECEQATGYNKGE